MHAAEMISEILYFLQSYDISWLHGLQIKSLVAVPSDYNVILSDF